MDKPKPTRPLRRLPSLALAGALLLGACHSGPETNTAASPATSDDPAAERVRAFNKELAALLRARAAEIPAGGGVKEALDAHTAELSEAESTREVLQSDSFTPRLVRRAELTPLGEAALEAIQQSPSHGLDPLRYGLPSIEVGVQALREQGDQIARESGEAPGLSDAVQTRLAALLRERGIAAPEAANAALLDVILTDDPAASAAPEIAAWYTRHVGRLEATAARSAELEVRLTDGLLALARDLRFNNLHNLSPEQAGGAVAGDAPTAAAPPAAARAAARRFVIELRQRSAAPGAAPEATRAEAAEQLAQLAPRFEQYARLRKGLEKLRAIQAAGGWPTDYPRIPRPRAREEVVRYSDSSRQVPEGLVSRVKRYLQAFDRFSGAIDDAWTPEFDAALLAHRESNQLWPRAWIDYELVEALKIPVEYRVAQTELTLQRWRESRIGDDPYFIFVNLPDFHAEVWDQGARKMRFRVVVGKDSRYRDKKTREWRYPNATPLFSSRMESVVFSPAWNVPARIKLQEIDPAREKDPEYMAKHNYEVVVSANGHEMIRQRPGPWNALGQVKLLFPNDHDVYIHDTQRKDLFTNPVRAYSHGCMRAEDPLALAHYVLSRESGEWTERRVRGQGGGTVESWQRLNDGPMVHVEYYTVRVSEAGELLFLDDVYELDAARLKAERGLDIGLLD